MTNSAERLDDIVSKGVVIDTHAEEALTLNLLVGRYANEIRSTPFNAFFGSLQASLDRLAILSVTRLYESPNMRYPIRSIPAAIELVHMEAKNLPVHQRDVLVQKLVEYGHDQTTIAALSDLMVTKLLADKFYEQLPRADGLNELSRALNALKTMRDKSIAHNEVVDVSQVPEATPTYGEIRKLLDYAKKFLGIVGIGYLTTVYEWSNGEYVLTTDAERASRSLKQLLKQAGVIS